MNNAVSWHIGQLSMHSIGLGNSYLKSFLPITILVDRVGIRVGGSSLQKEDFLPCLLLLLPQQRVHLVSRDGGCLVETV